MPTLIYTLLFLLQATLTASMQSELPRFEGVEEIPFQRLLFEVSRVSKSFPDPDNNPVRAASCRPAAKIHKLTKKTQPKKFPFFGLTNKLYSKQYQLADVFAVMRSSFIGGALYKQFLPLYGYQIKIKKSEFPASEKHRLAQYNPYTGLITYHQNIPLGTNTFIITHEIIHGLDKENKKAYQKIISLKKRFSHIMKKTIQRKARSKATHINHVQGTDYSQEEILPLVQKLREIDQVKTINTYRSEKLAYEGTYLFWKELKTLYPAYYAEREISSFSHPPLPTDDSVIKMFQLNPKYIQKYKSGLCQEIP